MAHPNLLLLDPTYEALTDAPVKGNIRPIAPSPARARALRVGLLANGKKNGLNLIEALYAQLAQRGDLRMERAFAVVKPDISLPPYPEDMARLVAETDLVLTAIGD